jgi:HEAT repeat protein
MPSMEENREPRGPGESIPDIPTKAKAPFLVVMQFFLIPLGVVAACVAVFVLFGLIASDDKSPRAHLDDITGRDFNRRWQAAFELSKLVARDPEAVRNDEALVAQLTDVFETAKNDPDPRVRRYLALTLGRIGHPRARPALIAALGDADPETALYAAWAVGAVGGSEGVPALAGALGHEDPGVRKMAAYALGALGDASAADALAERLEDEAQDVQWNAAASLALLGDARGVPVLHRMLDAEYLGRVPGITPQQKIEARVSALRALGALRHGPSLALVRALRAGDESLAVRNAAAEAEKAIAGEGSP